MTPAHLVVYALLIVVGLGWVAVAWTRDPDASGRHWSDAPGSFWGFMIAFLGWIGVLKYFQ